MKTRQLQKEFPQLQVDRTLPIRQQYNDFSKALKGIPQQFFQYCHTATRKEVDGKCFFSCKYSEIEPIPVDINKIQNISTIANTFHGQPLEAAYIYVLSPILISDEKIQSCHLSLQLKYKGTYAKSWLFGDSEQRSEILACAISRKA